MSIERDFDISMIAGLALKEKQIQQNYRPIIGVHKWFARRPGTLFVVCSWRSSGSVRCAGYVF